MTGPRRFLARALGAGLALALVTGALGAQADRFEGWSTIAEADWVYDPDERPVMGFSVRASTAARSAMNEARAALDRGEARVAAAALLEIMQRYADHVVQVDGRRWVGAGEWARYLLGARVPAEVRAALATDADRARIERAGEWRDVPALVEVARELDGLPEAEAALGLASRLLAERGEFERARMASARLEQRVDDAFVSALDGRLGDTVEPTPSAVRVPRELTPAWTAALVPHVLEPAYNPFRERAPIGEAPIAPVVPVVDERVVYVADGVSVFAHDLFNGRARWHHAGPLEEIELERSYDRFFDFSVYARWDRDRAVSPYLVARPTLTEDLVLASVQAAEPQRELERFDRRPINWPLPARRLVALDRESGDVVWRQERPELGERAFVNTFDVAGPPAARGGLVFASGFVTEGAISAYVAAFDIRNGDLVWRTYVCSGQQELTMFNRPFQEHTGSPPLHHDGAVFVSTNLGVVACVDAWTGRMRWVSAYEATPRPPSRSYNRNNRREIFWINQAPQAADEHVIVTPLDSPFATAFDATTGRTRWSIDALEQYRHVGVRNHVLASDDGRLYVTGERNLECFDARSGRQLWDNRLRLDRDQRLSGPPALVGDRILFPTTTSLLELDAETSEVRSERPWSPGAEGGSVVASGPVLLITDHDGVSAVLEPETALAEAFERARTSPEALLDAADLLVGMGRLDEADRTYEELIASGSPDLVTRAHAGHLAAKLQRARVEDVASAWNAVLEKASPWPATLLDLVPEAISRLEVVGTAAMVDAWLERFDEVFGSMPLSLGTLTPGGQQPAGLVLAMRRLDSDSPREGVVRLQGLIERFPDRTWEGLPVREWSARRIAARIDEHGPEVYATFERAARALFDAAHDEHGLLEVELRFPNAEVVAEARARRLRLRLDAGDAGEVFEELATLPGWSVSPDLAELRREVAENGGETDVVAALDGALPLYPDAPLARLPRGTLRAVEVAGSWRAPMRFPAVRGRASAAVGDGVLVTLDGPPQIACLDVGTGDVRWVADLVGGHSAEVPGIGLDLIAHDEWLIVRRGSRVEALSLRDGERRWVRELRGAAMSTIVSGGLVLCLSDLGHGATSRFVIEGFTLVNGWRGLRLDVPAEMQARLFQFGGAAVVYAYDAITRDGALVGARLHRLDPVEGRLGSETALPGTFAYVLEGNAAHESALLWGRGADAGTGLWLSAYTGDPLAPAWELRPDVQSLHRQQVLRVDDRRFVAALPGESRLDTVVIPFDVEKGPGGATTYRGWRLVEGQNGERPMPHLVLGSQQGSEVDFNVVDVRTGRLLHTLPGVLRADATARVAHAVDGFALVDVPLIEDEQERTATIRLFDAGTGELSYSETMTAGEGATRFDVATAPGGVAVASGDRLWWISSR